MSVDFGALFGLDVGAVELVLRTSVIYLLLVAVLRLLARREMGSVDLPDLLLLVLVADGVQNGMAGEYTSITGALIVAGTLFAWNYLLDYLAFRSVLMRRVLQPAPLELVKDGRMNRRNMRRELFSRDELMAELRLQDIDDIAQVELACLEHNGNVSVRKRGEAGGERKRAAGAGTEGQ